jgi:hypothetical protein
MTKRDWDAVEEYGESNFRRIEPGCYVAKIVYGEDLALKEYSLFLYDIAEGDFAGYYNDSYYADKDYAHRIIRSYKESALGFYKGFFKAVEKSNPGWQFNGDEHDARQFEGRRIGIVLQEEEYIGNDGELKIRLNVAKTVSADDVRDGTVLPLPIKRLEAALKPPAPPAPQKPPYDDVPF